MLMNPNDIVNRLKKSQKEPPLPKKRAKSTISETVDNHYYNSRIMLSEATKNNIKEKDTHLSVVAEILTFEKEKSQLERKAIADLNDAFGRKKLCPKCYGNDDKRETCDFCNGTGTLADPNMEAIKLMLSPKLPKTTLNLNAKISDMNTNDAINILGQLFNG